MPLWELWDAVAYTKGFGKSLALLTCWVMSIQTLVLAVDLTVAHELAPAALIHGMGVPRKHYLTVIHRQETLCGSPGSREEILALCCNKKYMPLDVLAWVRGTTLNCIIPPLRWHS